MMMYSESRDKMWLIFGDYVLNLSGSTGICAEWIFVSQGSGPHSSTEEVICFGIQVSETLR